MATLSLLSLHDDALTATLARARLTDHCALAATCKRVRRVILGKAVSVVRDRDGWTEYGIFALARTSDDGDDNTDIPSESLQFCCLSHKFDSNRDNIGPDGARAIASGLAFNSVLQTLDLGDSQLHPAGLSVCTLSICTPSVSTSIRTLSICTLDLGDSQLHPAGLRDKCSAFSVHLGSVLVH